MGINQYSIKINITPPHPLLIGRLHGHRVYTHSAGERQPIRKGVAVLVAHVHVVEDQLKSNQMKIIQNRSTSLTYIKSAQ